MGKSEEGEEKMGVEISEGSSVPNKPIEGGWSEDNDVDQVGWGDPFVGGEGATPLYTLHVSQSHQV